MDKTILRDQLTQALRGGFAFLPLKNIIENFPVEKINKNIPGVNYTPYQLMEHLRIAQWDILEFIKDQHHPSPDWPEGYWPDKSAEANVEDWDKSVKQFFTDLNEIEHIVNDDNIDLTGELPENKDYNYLREMLLVISHNAYHLGQLKLFAKSE